MALGAVTLYAGGGGAASVLVVAGVFAAVNLPSVSLWAAMGVQVRRLLGSPRRLRIFNWSMAAMLVASLWPSVAPLL
jgi:threonine/homoserine/homoserine lactone efflux protein